MGTSKNKMWTSANIILIGGLVTLILTYIATNITDKENKKDQQKLKDELAKQSQEYASKVDQYAQTQKVNDEVIKELQRQLIEEARKQVAKSDEIASLYKQLAESQNEVVALTKRTNASVTGGEGYCYINIYPNLEGSADIDVISESEYPLHNVEIYVRPWLFIDDFYVDKDFSDSYRKSTDFKEHYGFKVSVLPSKKSELVTSRHLGTVPFNLSKIWYYTIDFTATNDEWRQVWELSLDENSKPIVSHIVYKTTIENGVMKKVILKKAINSKVRGSLLDYLITEYQSFK